MSYVELSGMTKSCEMQLSHQNSSISDLCLRCPHPRISSKIVGLQGFKFGVNCPKIVTPLQLSREQPKKVLQSLLTYISPPCQTFS